MGDAGLKSQHLYPGPTMPSFLVCDSIFAIIPAYIFAACLDQKDVLTKRRSKYGLRLWAAVVSVVFLAIDSAVTSHLRLADSDFRLFAFDAGVVLIPLVYGMLADHTIMGLWFLASLVGLIGMLSLPGVAAH
jgi:hypothetical protein